jgi:hypothetical protein
MLTLTGPESQVIYVNPNSIISIRKPRSSEHFGPGVKCIINTVNGKFIAVIEDCATIIKEMK